MDRGHANADNREGVAVAGFEVPRSPDSSYNNPIPGPEDVARDPPQVPPHLNNNLVHYPPSQDDQSNLPVPENVVLNHLYRENSDRPVIAMGITHRFHSKYVTLVVYKPKPVRRR